jgi:hypothetical protein
MVRTKGSRQTRRKPQNGFKWSPCRRYQIPLTDVEKEKLVHNGSTCNNTNKETVQVTRSIVERRSDAVRRVQKNASFRHNDGSRCDDCNVDNRDNG